jgi:hypothetical protein
LGIEETCTDRSVGATWLRVSISAASVHKSASGFARTIIFDWIGQNDRRAAGKFGDDADIATHRFHGFSQRGKQEIAALLETRNAVLRYPEDFGDACLGEFAGLAEIAEAHFFSDKFGGTSVDFLSLTGI